MIQFCRRYGKYIRTGHPVTSQGCWPSVHRAYRHQPRTGYFWYTKASKSRSWRLRTSRMINTIFKDNLYSGKTVLVTGGGTGIGLRTAKEFGQLGANVMIFYSRKQENLDTGLKRLTDVGINAKSTICDIRDGRRLRHALRKPSKNSEVLTYW